MSSALPELLVSQLSSYLRELLCFSSRDLEHSSSSEINGVRSSVEVVVVTFHFDHFKLYHISSALQELLV